MAAARMAAITNMPVLTISQRRRVTD